MDTHRTDLPRPPGAAAPARERVPIALALQGGGSMGAFTWGVLDRLLDVPELDIRVVSGTSAGAMNAAALVQGLAKGGPERGRDEAKALLEALWRGFASAWAGPLAPDPEVLAPFERVMAPWFDLWRIGARKLSQRQINPLGLNPLRPLLEDLIDPTVFGGPGAPGIVVSATRLRTGEACLFQDQQVTVDALLASACLPDLFPAVEIGGEHFWDGAFASNPPIRALIEAGAPPDLLLVRTTPVEHVELPTSSADVRDRMHELAFTSALRHELQSISTAKRLLRDEVHAGAGNGHLARLCAARLHAIGADAAFHGLANASTRDTRWTFIREMRDLGLKACDEWLADHRRDLGQRATLDLDAFAAPDMRPLGIAATAD